MSDALEVKEIQVEAENGDKTTAKLFHCPCPENSGGEDFFLIFVVEGHLHFQCASCDASYCQAKRSH